MSFMDCVVRVELPASLLLGWGGALASSSLMLRLIEELTAMRCPRLEAW